MNTIRSLSTEVLGRIPDNGIRDALCKVAGLSESSGPSGWSHPRSIEGCGCRSGQSIALTMQGDPRGENPHPQPLSQREKGARRVCVRKVGSRVGNLACPTIVEKNDDLGGVGQTGLSVLPTFLTHTQYCFSVVAHFVSNCHREPYVILRRYNSVSLFERYKRGYPRRYKSERMKWYWHRRLLRRLEVNA